MARYLITGVAGFLGSWLAKDLVERGETVCGLDNLSTGSLHNLDGIEDSVEIFHADLRDPKAVDAACKGVDFIFHMAGIDSVQQTIEDPIGSSQVNLDGTLHLIAAAQKHGVKRLVFASSAAVYGDHAKSPISEDTHPNPLSPYATQKLSCEQYLANAAAISGLETVSLRFFTVFGPCQSAACADSSVVAQFTARMLGTDQAGPVIFGDGEQSRDFVYVSDAVRACVLSMAAPATLVSGKVFNVGSGRAKSIRLTFETLACMIGFTGQPRFVQERPFDARRPVADLTAARQAFGYAPQISYADGLYRTVKGYRQAITTRTARPMLERRRSERTVVPAILEQVRMSAGRHIDPQVFAMAVHNDQLELFYQPILDLQERRVKGVEALLRWRNGNRLLTPAHFMHLAEEKGLTATIGSWVLQSACEQIGDFHRNFRADLLLSINVPAAHLEQAKLLYEVDGVLAQTGLEHTLLEFEVVERTLVRECNTTQQNLLELRKRGIRIAVDDFGTGYSNMNYLHKFPIDCIKIDQSFVQHRGHARVLNGIVAFASTLGVQTVAEGVETPYQLSNVRAVGCNYAQGFFIGRPVPATHLVQLIQTLEANMPSTEQVLEPELTRTVSGRERKIG